MSLLKLRLSMIGTLAAIIGISTLFLTVILTLIGAFNIIFLGGLVIAFNIAQWLLAPYLIDAIYRVKKLSRSENPRLYEAVERLCRKIKLKKPKLMLARLSIPNAFAYGSPITGTKVAVTSGLLEQLNEEEVEAVIGHELGHLKHRDVQIMMFASILPAIFYYIGYSLMLSSWYRGGERDRGGGALPLLIGLASMAIYWVLTLFVLGLSRLREYYADQLSARTVPDGARKLSRALAKIVFSTSRMKRHYRLDTGNLNSFKALFITDLDRAEAEASMLAKSFRGEELVERILRRRVTLADRIAELFSTHPNIVKRLRALKGM
ncbi:TPA: protease HtpX [Candidatus Bathyarchaeota archaeon]|nr:protease HtpX [Candidatus Bathyarchaeota archaeon]